MTWEDRRAPVPRDSRGAAGSPPGSLHHDGPGIYPATDARERDRYDLVGIPRRPGLLAAGEDDGRLIPQQLLRILQQLDALVRVQLGASRIDERVVLRVGPEREVALSRRDARGGPAREPVEWPGECRRVAVIRQVAALRADHASFDFVLHGAAVGLEVHLEAHGSQVFHASPGVSHL